MQTIPDQQTTRTSSSAVVAQGSNGARFFLESILRKSTSVSTRILLLRLIACLNGDRNTLFSRQLLAGRWFGMLLILFGGGCQSCSCLSGSRSARSSGRTAISNTSRCLLAALLLNELDDGSNLVLETTQLHVHSQLDVFVSPKLQSTRSESSSRHSDIRYIVNGVAELLQRLLAMFAEERRVGPLHGRVDDFERAECPISGRKPIRS
jgi:hypothetical protein